MPVDQAEILAKSVETLRADATLIALLGPIDPGDPVEARVWNHVPQDETKPYIVVTWQPDEDWDTKDSKGFDGSLDHEAISTHHGDKNVLEIADAVIAAYAANPLALVSGRIVCFDYESGSVPVNVFETHQMTFSFNVLVDADGVGGVPLPPAGGHAITHILNGVDEIDGDRIGIDYTPSNYDPDATVPEAGDVDHLAAHLAGIDDALVLNALIFGG